MMQLSSYTLVTYRQCKIYCNSHSTIMMMNLALTSVSIFSHVSLPSTSSLGTLHDDFLIYNRYMSILLYRRRFIIHSCDYCKAIVCGDDDSRVINLFMLNFVILENRLVMDSADERWEGKTIIANCFFKSQTNHFMYISIPILTAQGRERRRRTNKWYHGCLLPERQKMSSERGAIYNYVIHQQLLLMRSSSKLYFLKKKCKFIKICPQPPHSPFWYCHSFGKAFSRHPILHQARGHIMSLSFYSFVFA